MPGAKSAATPTQRSLENTEGTAVTVHYLDNSFTTIVCRPTTTVQDAVEDISSRLGMTRGGARFFGLATSDDGNHISSGLAPGDPILSDITDTVKLIFTPVLLGYSNNLVLPRDAVCKRLLFQQIHYKYVAGHFRVTSEEAALLAAYIMFIRVGTKKKYSDEFYTARLVELIPFELVKVKSKQKWGQEIRTRFEGMPANAKREDVLDNFLNFFYNSNIHRSVFLCGSALFYATHTPGEENLPRKMRVGVSGDGLFIYERDSQKVIKHYGMEDLFRWGFNDGEFYIDHQPTGDGDHAPLTFRTGGARFLAHVLTAYASHRLSEVRRSSMLSNVLPLSRDPTMMDPLETKSNSESMDMQKMVRVQCMVRGFIHRLRMKKEYCAIMLQSLYRGYRERCKFDAMLSG